MKSLNFTHPIIFHIPHASRIIPIDVRPSLMLSDSELNHELTKMTDAYTDDLFAPDFNIPRVVFPISRLVVDPERFLDDDLEIMAARGMGVIYSRTSDGMPLRLRPTVEEREKLIDRYYRPHHQALEGCASTCLRQFGRCLLIDCHSFPSEPLPYEDDQDSHRPDICIGTDDFHTPKWIENEIIRIFNRLGFCTKVNRPFSGSIVPMKFYQIEPRVMTIMVEINRKLYLEEKSGKKHGGFEALKNKLGDAISRIKVIAVQ
jgi:N-formylglutamate amidohydrolase